MGRQRPARLRPAWLGSIAAPSNGQSKRIIAVIQRVTAHGAKARSTPHRAIGRGLHATPP